MADILGLELVSQHLRAKQQLREELRLVKKELDEARVAGAEELRLMTLDRDEWKAATQAVLLALDKAHAKLERMELYEE